METLDYGPTGRKSGMILCTAGHRDVLLNGQPLRVQEGMVCLFTPLVALFELSRDDDYADIVIADDTTVFYSTVRTVIDIIANQRIFKRPYLVCTRAYIDYFKRQHTAIEAKRASLREARSKEEERLLTQTLHLLEQEAMLEFVYQYCTSNGTDGQELEKGDSIIFGFFLHPLSGMQDPARRGLLRRQGQPVVQTLCTHHQEQDREGPLGVDSLPDRSQRTDVAEADRKEH